MDSIFHVSFPGLGIHDLLLRRELFRFTVAGHEISIYWYGVIITLALLLSVLLSYRQAPEYGIKGEDVLDCFLFAVPFGIVGARLYYVAFAWEQFRDRPELIINTRYGGLAFYGAVIGGILAIFLVASWKKIPLLRMLDFLAVYLPLGQAIGRWGNFVNQEAFGTNTDLPWGMISEGTIAYLKQFGSRYAALSPVHPTFLYESIGNMLIFALLLGIRKRSTFSGQTLASYFFLYGLLRYFVEGIRTDPLMLGQSQIRVSQLLSLLMVLAALAYYLLAAWARRRGWSLFSPPFPMEEEEGAREKDEWEEGHSVADECSEANLAQPESVAEESVGENPLE